MIEVRQLNLGDLEALVALRAEALANHPLAFGATSDEDRLLSSRGKEVVADTSGQSVVFGGFEGEVLEGIVGLHQAAGGKRRHKGMVWGMYVRPSARRKGIGHALLEAAIGHARSWPDVRQLQLSVTDAAGEARRLYLSAGFTEWGREPRSLSWQGQVTDESHLVLILQ